MGAGQRGEMTASASSDRGIGMRGSAEQPADGAWLSRTELLMVFLFWTFMALVIAANPRGGGMFPAPWTTAIALAFVQSYVWALLTPPMVILASRYGVDRSNRVSRILMYVLLGVVIAFLFDQLMSHLQREIVTGGGPGGRGGAGRGIPAAADAIGSRVGRGGRGFGGPGGPPGPGGPGEASISRAFRRPWILNHFVLYFAVLAAGFARDY